MTKCPHNPNTAGLAGVVSELVAWRHTAGCSDYVDRYGWFAHRLFWRWWWLEAKNARDFAMWRSDADLCIRS